MLLFLCVYNLVIESMLAKTVCMQHIKPRTKVLRVVVSGKSIQIRHTLGQGVIEAVGTVFRGRPTGRKVTEPAQSPQWPP